MNKHICPNGHMYDYDIYGVACPLCIAKNDVLRVVGSSPIDENYQRPMKTLYGCRYPNDKGEKDVDEKCSSLKRKKLVGFLVTYDRTPMGKAFNIYEGRNFIGRDAECDISIPDDNQMSGKHMVIRYLTGDGKFRFRDEMTSNGTYVNKELLDEGELHNYDIIRVGNTSFVFIAIPQKI